MSNDQSRAIHPSNLNSPVHMKPGQTRVRITGVMPEEPDPLPIGSQGTVNWINMGTVAQIGVRWDNGRNLLLLPGIDPYEIVREEKA